MVNGAKGQGRRARSANFGTLTLLFVAAIWGATLSLTKIALNGMSVNQFLVLRFGVAVVVLAPFLVLVDSHLVTVRNTVISVCLGVLLYGIFYLQSVGLESTSTVATGFITGTYVVLVPVISKAIFRTQMGKLVWVGVGMTVIGLGFVSGGKLFSLGSGSWKVLISAVLIAVDIIAVEKFMPEVDAIWLAFVEIVIAAVLSLLKANLFSGNPIHLAPFHSWAIAGEIGFNGVLGTAFALWAQNYYQVIVPSAQVAVIFSSEPIFAALVAWLLFHGTISANLAAGGMFVLVGIIICDLQAFSHLVSKILVLLREIDL